MRHTNGLPDPFNVGVDAYRDPRSEGLDACGVEQLVATHRHADKRNAVGESRHGRAHPAVREDQGRISNDRLVRHEIHHPEVRPRAVVRRIDRRARADDDLHGQRAERVEHPLTRLELVLS